MLDPAVLKTSSQQSMVLKQTQACAFLLFTNWTPLTRPDHLDTRSVFDRPPDGTAKKHAHRSRVKCTAPDRPWETCSIFFSLIAMAPPGGGPASPSAFSSSLSNQIRRPTFTPHPIGRQTSAGTASYLRSSLSKNNPLPVPIKGYARPPPVNQPYVWSHTEQRTNQISASVCMPVCKCRRLCLVTFSKWEKTAARPCSIYILQQLGLKPL